MKPGGLERTREPTKLRLGRDMLIEEIEPWITVYRSKQTDRVRGGNEWQVLISPDETVSTYQSVRGICSRCFMAGLSPKTSATRIHILL
jgi:hypothetical protein